jgi:hypothetical protein
LLELLITPIELLVHLPQRLLELLITPTELLVAASFAPLDGADQAPEQHRENGHDDREDDGRNLCHGPASRPPEYDKELACTNPEKTLGEAAEPMQN